MKQLHFQIYKIF